MQDPQEATGETEVEVSTVTTSRQKWIGLAAVTFACLLNYAIIIGVGLVLFAQIQKTYDPYDVDEASLSPFILRVSGWSPLHLASARGDSHRARQLLSKGHEVDVTNQNGRTPLYEAAKRGRLDTIEALVAYGASVNASETKSGVTPLHAAGEKHHVAAVRALLQHGAIVDAKNTLKQTPLHQASWQAWHQDSEVAQVLLQHGADVDAKDKKGFTPLLFAAESGHLPLVEFLLDRGADVNARCTCSDTALHRAVRNSHLEVVELLLTRGAEVNQKTHGKTALELALDDEDEEMVELLSRYGGKEFKVAKAHVQRGFDLRAQGQLDEALAAYAEALQVDPNSSDAYLHRGMVWIDKGNYDSATTDFGRAIAIEPLTFDAYANLSWIHAQRKEWDKGIALWSELIALDPDNGHAYYERAHHASFKGDHIAMRKDLNTACTLGYTEGCSMLGRDPGSKGA